MNKIVCIINDKKMVKTVEIFCRNMQSKGIDTTLISRTQWESGVAKVGATKEINIYITDSGSVVQDLQMVGHMVVAYRHNYNREENFQNIKYEIQEIQEISAQYMERVAQRLQGLPWTILKTKRCVIRETTVADVDAFYRIYQAPSVTEYMEPLYEDPEEEREYARNYSKHVYEFYGHGMWTVVREADGTILGRAGISYRDGFILPELGFVIAPAYQRSGYAFEVCSAILQYGKKELALEQVQALVRGGNVASINLCKKLGFEKEDMVEVGQISYERYMWPNC